MIIRTNSLPLGVGQPNPVQPTPHAEPSVEKNDRGCPAGTPERQLRELINTTIA